QLTPFDSVMRTSLLNYLAFTDEPRYQALAEKSPVFADCGIDFMITEQGPIFAELQFSHQSYPQSLMVLQHSYQLLCSELLDSLSAANCDYQFRYEALLQKTINLWTQLRPENAASGKYLIDAWAMPEHLSRNNKMLATTLEMNYL